MALARTVYIMPNFKEFSSRKKKKPPVSFPPTWLTKTQDTMRNDREKKRKREEWKERKIKENKGEKCEIKGNPLLIGIDRKTGHLKVEVVKQKGGEEYSLELDERD